MAGRAELQYTAIKSSSFLENSTKKVLTQLFACGILLERMEEAKAFFLCLKIDSVAAVVLKKKKARGKLCALESHWHVQNANSVTTT